MLFLCVQGTLTTAFSHLAHLMAVINRHTGTHWPCYICNRRLHLTVQYSLTIIIIIISNTNNAADIGTVADMAATRKTENTRPYIQHTGSSL